MVRIIMIGCNGKMGRTISELAAVDEQVKIVAGIDLNPVQLYDYPVFVSPEECDVEADVLIDFSSTQKLTERLCMAVERNMPIVLCTTGLSEEQYAQVKEASGKVAVLRSANMSLGINTIMKLVAAATKVFAAANFDIEIVEKHHNQKVDAPSGTAVKTASLISGGAESYTTGNCVERESMDGARGANAYNNIHIHSVRMPGYMASQEVLFGSKGQILTIRHDSTNRECYMPGVLLGIRYAASNDGFVYGLDKIMEI